MIMDSNDCKTGIDFENKVVNMLTGLGFKANRVGKNDGGIDIFASIDIEDNTFSFNIQCKYYNRPLGKEPIQEVFTGTHYYDNGALPVVFTNNAISYEARLYAKKLNVEIIADIEREELKQVFKTRVVINRNHGTLMKIILSIITNDRQLLPSKTQEKKEITNDKERLKLEILNKYEIAEELSREAAKLSLEAANRAQESLRLQKEAMLTNLEYG